MYLNLGKTNIKYKSGYKDDFIILSEVVNSQLSYENPILIRTKDELDIWFGKNFDSRDYFDELLKQNVTLYLYKPVSNELAEYSEENYIDLDLYYPYPEIYHSIDNLPETGLSEYRYYVENLPRTSHFYTFGYDEVSQEYIWLDTVSDDLSGYTLDSNIYNSIYDLPTIGQIGVIYQVSEVPEYKHWYIWNPNTEKWENTSDYNTYVQYYKKFSTSSNLFSTNKFRYYTIKENKWYTWEDDGWTETNNETIMSFPIHFDSKESLPETGDNYKYYVLEDSDWYIWNEFDESWLSEDLFPQNIDNLSSSINNKDTLLISKIDENNQNIPYSYPEFKYGEDHLGVFSREYDIDYSEPLILTLDDLEKINLGQKTLAFRLQYTTSDLSSEDGKYIIIDSPSDINYSYLYYTGSKPNEENLANYHQNEGERINTVEELIEKLRNIGYKTEKIGDYEYLIYSNSLIDFTNFYTYKSFKLINDFDTTHNIITNNIGSNGLIEFYSNTIGADLKSENSQIEITIERTEYERYRITINRFDYHEVFEGPLFPIATEEERIDNIINKNSKLVKCNILGIKNAILPSTYFYKVDQSGKIEDKDFTASFNMYENEFYWTPETGETGKKYTLTSTGLWKIWVNDTWKIIDNTYYDFFELEDIGPVQYNTYLDLPNVGDSNFKYFVVSENCYYIWKNNHWKPLESSDGVKQGDIITISIDRIDFEDYTITISTGDYSETFSGYLFELDEIITNKSSLIHDFKFLNLYNSIRTGTYTLRRGKEEAQNSEMYKKALNCLFDIQVENVYPDFFLVPDYTKYIDKLDEDYTYYREYKDVFLEHAKNFNCQFLIENSPSKYKLETLDKDKDFSEITNPEQNVLYKKTYDNESSARYMMLDEESGELVEIIDKEIIGLAENGNSYIFNYIDDTYNYLLYFYNPMSINYKRRPGYYIFLKGTINNVFSLSTNNILYDTPTKQDPYELEYLTENLTSKLEKYKSNFLICNNHIYYYKKLFSGEKYYSSIHMRFILGKIYRELQKHRWDYLATRSLGGVKTSIEKTLKTIEDYFSIARQIILVEFKPNLSNNFLEISINTYLTDLVDNNMSLDITINYNNNTY